MTILQPSLRLFLGAAAAVIAAPAIVRSLSLMKIVAPKSNVVVVKEFSVLRVDPAGEFGHSFISRLWEDDFIHAMRPLIISGGLVKLSGQPIFVRKGR